MVNGEWLIFSKIDYCLFIVVRRKNVEGGLEEKNDSYNDNMIF